MFLWLDLSWSLDPAPTQDTRTRRDREVRRNREDVPHQRAAKIGPDPIRIRDRSQKPDHPDAADVNSRENACAHDRKQCHSFSRAVDRGTPFLATEMQNGRDQCSGVTDADPEYKIGNAPGPTDRNVIAPHTNTGEQKIKNTECTKDGEGSTSGNGNLPPPRRFVLYDPGYSIRDPRHRVVIPDDRKPWHPFLKRNRWSRGLRH
jgi:hypothetical protein